MSAGTRAFGDMILSLKAITLLGSTGSIGTSTLDVIRRWPERFRVFALVAGQNLDVLVPQILEFRPEVVVVATTELLEDLTIRLGTAGLALSAWPELLSGPEARVAAAVAEPVDFVLSAIVGVAGLEATYAAVQRGKTIGLANKEVLVASGKLVMDAARAAGTELIPVDSEHNGAHQCLRAGRRAEVKRLILTASGGPFRKTPASEFPSITKKQALNHPTWKMGPRITIDSATLMNKGFEVIEACWLFGFAPSEVGVVVHPQSSVHAMVEFADGSVMAQVSTTDMRMPIQYALTYPERADAQVPRLNWEETRTWEFSPPDRAKFPLLQLAYDAQEAGGSATCTLNAADEIAVEAFLQEQISFPGIAEVISETLSKIPSRTPSSVAEVLDIDRESRLAARECVRQRATVGA
ncbi:MAG TPA: 1-deoxy-D-xylulose-5-phosphate reductoisomerase [Bryobacteraceae bacterium]|nr:1-deoxy-D-xylulose-5-phosphate reductoisomerase [Bryobacteraceae bacterium]